ncbi:protein SERAC1-like [Centruroides sculpturatus]|uniref:protein SERAC1-like n=2 Tax=Centruroides sculpturatus TaxID=218467 RepID=UPI000C6D67FC|nr:protein SERAC1-like [Centruroides sculpturatus]XP_023242231.1 protein SERAC1-like [Centruroides sculpturatus]
MKFTNKWNFVQRKGVFGGLLAFCIGGGYLAREVYTSEGMWNAINSISYKAPKEDKESDYIYLSKSYKDDLDNEEVNKYSWWPWNKKEHKIQWHLLRLAQSKDRQVRHVAVKALSELPHLNDSEFREIAQACDMRTAIGLARTHGTDLRFFLLPSIHTEYSENEIETELKNLLASLPDKDISKCIQYFTQQAIKIGYQKVESDNKLEWNIDNELNGVSAQMEFRPRSVSHETIVKTCLRALLSHSTILYHRKLIVEKGILLLLHRINNHHKNHEVTSLIIQILGNLVEDKSLHKHLFMTGWIRTLTSLSRSPHLELSLPASRALVNLDSDKFSDEVYEDGIYLLYPQLRGRDKHLNADVIFIHGLLGGAFRTWRQKDEMKLEVKDQQITLENDKVWVTPDKQKEPSFPPSTFGTILEDYTFCWPKDWLSRECPHLRILAVDYYSHFTVWKDECRFETENRSLLSRSNEILKKLVAAGVGNKPIIWVTHSMGGLLVKQMLLEAAKNRDPSIRNVLENSVGVVFCSVPHRGSSLATVDSGWKLILLPTKEVKELKKDSSYLLDMHEKFKQLAKKHDISCLSFGETQKTNLGLKLSTLMVSLDSSDPSIGEFYALPENHLNTCKPETKSSVMYQLLVDFIHQHVPHTLMENLLQDHNVSAEDLETTVVMGLVQ